MRVQERILAKFWRASRAKFNSRARSLYGIGAVQYIWTKSSGLLQLLSVVVVMWSSRRVKINLINDTVVVV